MLDTEIIVAIIGAAVTLTSNSLLYVLRTLL